MHTFKKRKRKFYPSKPVIQEPITTLDIPPVQTYRKAKKKDHYWYIADGYLNDLIDLLEDFEKLNSLKYEDFAACWRKKFFSLVYRGRQTFKELLEFSEEIAFLTKRFLLRPHSIKRRIGALYCLYGLYFKHPVRQFFDLRFDLQEYQETLELVQPFRCNTENSDPALIFNKLEVSGAIKHCATSMEMCFEFQNRERELVDLEYGKEKLAKSSAVNEALPSYELEANQQLLKHYDDMKQKLSGNNPENRLAVCLVNPDLFTGVIDELSQLKENVLNQLSIKQPEESTAAKGLQLERMQVIENEISETTESTRDQLQGKVQDNITVNESMKLSSNGNVSRRADILSSVNKGKRESQTQIMEDEKRILSNERIDNFMAQSMLPLRGPRKKRRKSTLNLNDMKSDAYVEPLPHSELILPVPQFRKEKRGRRRTKALQKSINARPARVSKGFQYKPDPPKLFKEEFEFIGVPAVPNSATSLVLSNQTTINPDMLQMLVKIDCNGELVNRKLNVKVSLKQWDEMQNDSSRMERFQKKILPLLGIARIASDEVSIVEIVAVPAEDTVKKKKPLSNTNRAVMNSAYLKEQRCMEESDTDYDPFSDNDTKSVDIDGDEFQLSTDVDSHDEVDDLEAVDENLSDEEDPNYFRSVYFREKSKRNYYAYREYAFERERVGVLNNDLIEAKKTPASKLKMIPVKVGPCTKYVPVQSGRYKCTDDVCDPHTQVYTGNELKDLGCVNSDIMFHSFNDYTTVDKPPPTISRNSFSASLKKNTYPYTIMCVRSDRKTVDNSQTDGIIPESKEIRVEPSEKGEKYCSQKFTSIKDWCERRLNKSIHTGDSLLKSVSDNSTVIKPKSPRGKRMQEGVPADFMNEAPLDKSKSSDDDDSIFGDNSNLKSTPSIRKSSRITRIRNTLKSEKNVINGDPMVEMDPLSVNMPCLVETTSVKHKITSNIERKSNEDISTENDSIFTGFDHTVKENSQKTVSKSISPAMKRRRGRPCIKRTHKDVSTRKRTVGRTKLAKETPLSEYENGYSSDNSNLVSPPLIRKSRRISSRIEINRALDGKESSADADPLSRVHSPYLFDSHSLSPKGNKIVAISNREQLEEKFESSSPTHISAESDAVFFHDFNQEEPEQFSIEKHEALSPLKPNTALKNSPSIEDLATDWDIEEESNAAAIHFPQLTVDPSMGQTYIAAAPNLLIPVNSTSPGKMLTFHAIDIFNSPQIRLANNSDNFIYAAPFNPVMSEPLNITDTVVDQVSPTPEKFSIPAPPSVPSPRRTTCGFLFSSKFKSLKRLNTSLGEASGKPPTPRRTVQFFRKGFLRN